MKNEIVSFRIARILSTFEDFKEDCYFGYIAEYDESTDDYTKYLYMKSYPTGRVKGITINNKYREYLAPTYQSVRKWLVKTMNISYIIYKNVKDKWEAETKRGAFNVVADSYEEAEELFIINTLNIIKNDNC